MKDEKILLGKINGLFGVKGWVKVFSYTRPRHKIVEYKQWYLDDEYHLVELEQGKAHKAGVIAKFKGVDDCDAAQALMNQKIWVTTDQFEVLADNEYYWFQLIGLEVFDCQDQRLGEITDLMETGANDVLIVRGGGKGEHLIPYVQGKVIKTVDLDKKCIVVDWDVDY